MKKICSEKYVRYLMADDIGVWGNGGDIMWKSGRNINSRRAALAEGYMEDTGEPRQEIFREHSHDTGTFYYIGAHDRGAMIFNYDFHGADLIALLFCFYGIIFWSRSSIDR